MDTQLSESEVEVLEKGLNFSSAPNKIPTTHLMATVERGLSKRQSDVASDARKRILSLLSRSKPPQSNLTPEQKKAVERRCARDDILILPADKGWATVVMARDDYLDKMNVLLTDEKMYQPLEKDPTPSLEWKMNALHLQLKRKGSESVQPSTLACCMASLRYISPMYHCAQLSLLCNPIRTSSKSILLISFHREY